MEQPPKPPIETFSLKPTPPLDLKTLPHDVLLKMRGDIDAILGTNIQNLNMTEELSIQLHMAKSLYAKANDESTPANQKAQVLNTISSIIASITKSQVEIYSVARLKRIEAAVLAAVQPLPMEAKERFFDLYKEYLDAPDRSAGFTG